MDGGEGFDDLFIVHLFERCESWNQPCASMASQVEDGALLAARDSNLAKTSGLQLRDSLGSRPFHREESEEPEMNRAGGLAGELLVDDGSQQELEGGTSSLVV